MLSILTISSFITAIISGVLGMGGGILLLSIMTFFLAPTVIIPIHGIVQLASNASRVFYLRAHVKKNFFLYYCIGLPLGALISVFFLKTLISDTLIYTALLVLIFYSVFKPKKMPELKVPAPYWVFIGLMTGILAIIVGAVGPLLAAFFIRDDFSKEEIVSTKSSMQLVAHFIKIPAFLMMDFNYTEHSTLILFMSIAVIAGTKVGVKLLEKVDNSKFKLLFKLVLFIAGLRVGYKLFEVL